MTSPNTNANRQIARAAGAVMLAILFSQLMGLVRSILVASAFPAAWAAAREVLSLPCFPELRPDEIDSVVAAVRSFFEGDA